MTSSSHPIWIVYVLTMFGVLSFCNLSSISGLDPTKLLERVASLLSSQGTSKSLVSMIAVVLVNWVPWFSLVIELFGDVKPVALPSRSVPIAIVPFLPSRLGILWLRLFQSRITKSFYCHFVVFSGSIDVHLIFLPW